VTASFPLTLDTTPPVVVASAPTQVEPPEVWQVTLDLNERLHYADFVFEDAMGVLHHVGHTYGDQQIFLLVPTVDFATGPGTLRGILSDDVANLATVSIPLSVNRNVAFSATLEIEHAFEMQVTMDHAFDVEFTMDRPTMNMILTLDHAFEVEFTLERD
jgi:hypothetical protein